MNLGGLLGQAQKMATSENTQKNGDPTEDAIKAAKLKIQMLQDFKKLGKQGFAEKYAGITDEQKKYIGYGKGYTIQEITEDFKSASKDWGDEKTISATLPELEKKYETQKAERLKQEETQKAEKLKQEQEFNTYKTDIDNFNKLKSTVKEKYKYDTDQKPVDFRQAYNEGVIKEANERIKTKNDVKVPGMPDEKNTCISGTCTLAANQGVSFNKMSGNKDSQGRVIPINNQLFYNQLANSGYEEIPYEQRAPGDFVQYDDESGKKEHMEILLDRNQKTGVDRNYNNYSLSNYNKPGESFKTPGESFRKLVKKPDGTIEAVNTEAGFDPFPNSRILRIKDETAKAAYLKLHPEYAQQLEGQKAFETSDDFKSYTALNDKIEALKKSNPDLYKKLTTTTTETTTDAKK